MQSANSIYHTQDTAQEPSAWDTTTSAYSRTNYVCYHEENYDFEARRLRVEVALCASDAVAVGVIGGLADYADLLRVEVAVGERYQ